MGGDVGTVTTDTATVGTVITAAITNVNRAACYFGISGDSAGGA